MLELTTAQIERFHQDGMLLLDSVLDDDSVAALRDHYTRMFDGEFETGVLPDEVNWQSGRSDPTLTRQICNGWKGDRTVASVVLRPDFGRAIAHLMGWSGARVMVDNVLWKPVGARSLGHHQDCAYLDWFTPKALCSLWLALDDCSAENGTMELVRGSHRWQHSTPEGEFHAPADYRAPMMRAAAREGVTPEIVPVAVPRGGGSIHHGWTWHGSGPNVGSEPRRSLVLHAMPANVRYDRSGFGKGTGPTYCRYSRLSDDTVDENYFPILWREDGYRTPGLEAYCAGPRVAGRTPQTKGL